jgi:hypothetical protein
VISVGIVLKYSSPTSNANFQISYYSKRGSGYFDWLKPLASVAASVALESGE